SKLRDFFYQHSIHGDLILCAHDHFMDFILCDNNAIQLTLTPNWSGRSKFRSLSLDNSHTPESELVKKIFGYNEAIFNQLNNKLCYTVFSHFRKKIVHQDFEFFQMRCIDVTTN